jgi:hypothetical protein
MLDERKMLLPWPLRQGFGEEEDDRDMRTLQELLDPQVRVACHLASNDQPTMASVWAPQVISVLKI